MADRWGGVSRVLRVVSRPCVLAACKHDIQAQYQQQACPQEASLTLHVTHAVRGCAGSRPQVLPHFVRDAAGH